MKSPCHKLFERNRNQRSDPNQDVEVIVETDAVVDNENLVECDVEAGIINTTSVLNLHNCSTE